MQSPPNQMRADGRWLGSLPVWASAASYVARVRLLLPYVAGADLGRIAHPQLVARFGQQVYQPMTVSDRFHPDQRRQLPVKSLGLARGVPQLLLSRFSRLAVQPGNMFPLG